MAGWLAHTCFSITRPCMSGFAAFELSRLDAAGGLDADDRLFYLALFHPATHFGIFFLPLVLGLVAPARWLCMAKVPFPRAGVESAGAWSMAFRSLRRR